LSKINISKNLHLDLNEISFSFTASPGPGGQNVNKVATAVLLRFNVLHSMSLPPAVRERLVKLLGNRVTKQGDILIKASRFRTQERNKQDTLNRLCHLIARVAEPPKKRIKTKPTFASKQRRLETKKRQGKKKTLRAVRCE
jgi:ribosome-associated protein